MLSLVAGFGISGNEADAHHRASEPTGSALIKAYPRLYAVSKERGIPVGRNLLKHGRAKDGKIVWSQVRKDARRMYRAINAKREREHLIRYLDTHPSQQNNMRLAKLLYPDQFWAFDQIIGGGDGIGGQFGESDWHHDIWNGGHRGAWPDRTGGGTTAAACSIGDAYGLGQACERYKMQQFAGTTRIYDSPLLQLRWMVYYANGRFGSIEAAANSWRANGHW